MTISDMKKERDKYIMINKLVPELFSNNIKIINSEESTINLDYIGKIEDVAAGGYDGAYNFLFYDVYFYEDKDYYENKIIMKYNCKNYEDGNFTNEKNIKIEERRLLESLKVKLIQVGAME